MNLFVKLLARDFSIPLKVPAVSLEVNRYSWNAIGGPEEASLTAYGSQEALWELAEWLRAPIEIGDERGDPLWWGYLHEVRIRVGSVEVGVSLDQMYNRVAVAYSELGAGFMAGSRATTSWAQDDDSVAAYGTREMLAALSEGSQESAESKRDALLNERKYPVPVVSFAPGRGSLSASLVARGWWQTLAWQYHAQNAGREVYEDDGEGTQNLGDDSSRQKLAQSLSLATDTSWEAQTIWLSVRAEGSPGDTLYARLYSDSGGAPGTLLAMGSVAGSSLGDYLTWTEFTLDTKVAISYGTTYWIVVERSGSVSAANYYVFDVNEDLGYTRGELLIWNGSSWGARTPDADVNFRLMGVRETTVQIEDAVEAEGQYISEVDVEDASGIYTNPYRDGDGTALSVIKGLLQSGTTNERRLLATVEHNRALHVFEEPALQRIDVGLFVNADGQLVDRWGAAWTRRTSPAGQWAGLLGVIPSTLNTSRLADVGYFFVEGAEFDPQAEAWKLEPRGAGSPWDVAGIEEG